MNQEFFEVSLAGLIHDIGKILQRGRDDPRQNPPLDEPGLSGHAAWTTYFAERIMPEPYRRVGYQAAYHHSPEKTPVKDQRLVKIVSLADKLSAGERIEADQGEYPEQMVSIFDQIYLPDGQKREEKHFLPISQLKLEEKALFPTQKWASNKVKDAYREAGEYLEAVLGEEEADSATYLEKTLSAFQQAAFNIPSAYYYSKPDVSLYDHSRMTAAIGSCLIDFDTSVIEELNSAVKKAFLAERDGKEPAEDVQKTLEKEVAVLIGGDISGVQDFIYSITSKRAAKTLRGRSFYLQLLTEAILRYLLRELELAYTNVIYSGGGHFFLLAPLSVLDPLKTIQKEISRKMLRHHGTRLYLALGHTRLKAEDFKLGRFPDCWQRMHKDVNRAKQQRYRELGGEFYPLVFAPEEHGGNREKICSVCGEERPGTRQLQDAEDRVCPLCASFADDIGKELPGTDHVLLGLGEPEKQPEGSALNVLREFGLEIVWGSEIDAAKPAAFPEQKKVERVLIWTLGDDVYGQEVSTDLPAAFKKQYTVNLIPEEKGRPLTFDKLQEEARGIPRLGVLRMDVDNLGDIFSKGLGDQASLARLSTLSFQVSLFFEGWIKKRCEEEPFQGLIYAVYAGGDDVFLIGAWHIMPELARTISRDLHTFTGQHPDIHLSGGLSFIHGKYPVYQAAEDAGVQEKQAKAHPGKNAFSFLGKVFTWDDFQQVEEQYRRLLRVAGKPGQIIPELDQKPLNGPQSLLQTLRELLQEKEKRRKENQRLQYGPWIWHGVYRLRRLEEQYKKQNRELAGEIGQIRKELDEHEYQNLGQWGKAARWAQLRLRTSE